jgi:hypothetical protein
MGRWRIPHCRQFLETSVSCIVPLMKEFQENDGEWHLELMKGVVDAQFHPAGKQRRR